MRYEVPEIPLIMLLLLGGGAASLPSPLCTWQPNSGAGQQRHTRAIDAHTICMLRLPLAPNPSTRSRQQERPGRDSQRR
jgi:hypothetical protein